MPPLNTPQLVPEYLIAGQIWNWEVSSPNFNPGGGFSLAYYFNQLNPPSGTPYLFTLAWGTQVQADGSSFWTYVDSTTISSLAAGEYKWFSQYAGVNNGSNVRDIFQRGVLTVFPNPSSGVDMRTAEEQILDALNAMITSTATLEQEQYSIGDRHISKMNRVDLLKYRNYYKAIVVAQRKKMSFESGNVKATNGIRTYFAPTYGNGLAPGNSMWNVP